ncbi:MAG: hypothetical protein NWF05_07680, partial [Candidatus Bathyarchaeota archaeon]|nr:hypothetical protein [Candidatus Bathyarchaeota archaeon]
MREVGFRIDADVGYMAKIWSRFNHHRFPVVEEVVVNIGIVEVGGPRELRSFSLCACVAQCFEFGYDVAGHSCRAHADAQVKIKVRDEWTVDCDDRRGGWDIITKLKALGNTRAVVVLRGVVVAVVLDTR